MQQAPAQIALTEAVYYILLSLYNGPMHGYGMMQAAEAMSGGRVTLGPGTLYGALNTLLEKGWIATAERDVPDTRKKAYALTRLGREILGGELSRLRELLATAANVMGGTEACDL